MSFSDAEVERYARHLVLAEIGGPGQQRLKAASVAIVGAGGVGCPAALYLTAAGVGRLTLIDDDHVALSNLQRQVLFETGDIDQPKASTAVRRLASLNPHVEVRPLDRRLTAHTAADMLTGHDLVLDGTDSFETRLAVSDACVSLGLPLVSAALGRWTCQVGVFEARPCYRCLTPAPPPGAETCARVGVVGALAGVAGSLAALEAIKLITGAGEPLTGRLLIFDGLQGASRTVRVQADPDCPACGHA